MISHLVELRARLLKIILVFVITFLVLFSISQDIYSLLAEPFLRFLPEGQGLIATQVAAPLIVPMKLSLYVALLIVGPFCFYQIWAFIVPGLYPREKKLFFPVLLASVCLFYLGVAFAYCLVLPLMFHFFIMSAPVGIQVMPDMSAYLEFVCGILMAFGCAFQCPIVSYLLIYLRLVSVEALKEKRPYVIVGAFALGMILTPPDVISQTLLAIPLWFLFEMGLYFGAKTTKQAEYIS